MGVVFGAMIVAFWITLLFVLWEGHAEDRAAARLRWVYVAIFAFLSYPVLFALQLGNIELAMFVLLAAFVYLYYERSPLGRGCL